MLSGFVVSGTFGRLDTKEDLAVPGLFDLAEFLLLLVRQIILSELEFDGDRNVVLETEIIGQACCDARFANRVGMPDNYAIASAEGTKFIMDVTLEPNRFLLCDLADRFGISPEQFSILGVDQLLLFVVQLGWIDSHR